jgi:hypothetical protein
LKHKLLLIVFILGLASCTSTIQPTATFAPLPARAETVLPTAFYTPTFTITPTLTPIPMTATVTTEPTPFTWIDPVFVVGVNAAGEHIHGNADTLFRSFTAPSSEFASFHFILQITAYHYIKDPLTPSPTALPTETWKLSVYRYRTDGEDVHQPSIETSLTTEMIPYPDKLLMYMTADVSMQAIRTKFGDCSAFTYQVTDGQGAVQQQGNFAINPHVLFPSGGGLLGDLYDGVTLGFPYSLKERETEFFRQGQFVMIREPKSGFYRLTYTFSLLQASGISAVAELELLAGKLAIGLFPYREDAEYSASDAYPVTGNVLSVGGLYIVELPIDHLKENREGNNRYYLQMQDDRGHTIKDEMFEYVPYVP